MPDDFFGMLPAHYHAKIDGYNRKKRKEAELIRSGVWASKASWEGTISYSNWCNRFFPLWFDEQQEQVEWTMTEEQIKSVLERHEKYHPKKQSI